MSTRRILSLEALEDRTLLSGNVTAVWDPVIQGQLDITGDKGNNSITISQTTATSGVLRVAGNLTLISGQPPDFTKVNGVNYVDFTLSSITSIKIDMTATPATGKDTVDMGEATSPYILSGTGFAIPGNLTIAGGSSTETFSTSGLSANKIGINAAGPDADSVTMTNTNAGSVGITLGTGADSVWMDNSNGGKPGPKIGTLNIDTSASTASDSVTVQNFANVGTVTHPVPGIGRLTVNSTGGGNNTINVTNSTLTKTTLSSGSGSSTINVNGTDILTTLALTTGGGGSVKYDNSTAQSANIKVGTGTASTVDVSGDNITGSAGLTVNVGAAGNTAVDKVTANNDTVTGPMTVNVSDDGPQYWSTLPYPEGTILPWSSLMMNGDAVGGALGISTGNFFRFVTVGSENIGDATQQVTAGSGVTAGSLTATIGSGTPLTSNSETVQFNTSVSGAESITVGDFYSPKPPIPLLNPSTFSLNGKAGSLALTVGRNAAGGVFQNACVTGDESVSVGAYAGDVTMVRPTHGNNTVVVGANSGSVAVTGNDDAGDSVLTESITVKKNLWDSLTIEGNLLASGIGHWNENITVGDNDTVYADANVVGSETIASATGNGINVTVEGVTVSGALTITLPGSGDTITVDPSTVGSLAITVGDNATINVDAIVVGNETITSSTGNGENVTVGSSPVGGTLTINLPGSGNTVTVDPSTVSAMGITTGDNATISVSGTTVTGGDVSVGAGNGATIALDSVTDDNGSVNITALDNTTEIAVTNSSASTMNISNGNGNTFIDLEGDDVGTGGAVFGSGLNVTTGNGDNTIEMLDLNVLDGLFVTAGSGINSVFAGNVLCDFGTVDGGGGGSSIYYDLGGNLGFDLEGFVGQ